MGPATRDRAARPTADTEAIDTGLAVRAGNTAASAVRQITGGVDAEVSTALLEFRTGDAEPADALRDFGAVIPAAAAVETIATRVDAIITAARLPIAARLGLLVLLLILLFLT